MSVNRINPNRIKVRDSLMVDIIRGVTKGGYEKNIRKHQNRYNCRKPIRVEIEESGDWEE